MKRYDPSEIEPKWRQTWAEAGLYRVTEDPSRPKYYMLTEFPYPSGEGLHAGHIREYTLGDTMARHKRMQGYNVLYPMGFDEFGLPTENFAIKHKIKPQVATATNVANFIKQFQQMGYMFDWDRKVETADPAYYKWTQWLFLRFLEAGLAYQDEIAINWCPKEKTGLANEEVVNGKHERCGTPVEKKLLKQWLLRITSYADRLIEGLKTVDYPERIASQQINWIGRSEGAEIDFAFVTKPGLEPRPGLTVYTTRPDTIFGATFIVVAPEVARGWIDAGWDAAGTVRGYITMSIGKAELERQESKKKTGIDTGLRVIHPLSGTEIPVWVADYVLAGYGTGAIMAVPAHDERDHEFAVKFNLPITTVVEPITGTPQDNEEYRRSIVALVRDPKTNQVLSINWGKQGGNLFIGGGMDDGEDVVATARREVQEETGYTKLKLIGQSECIHHHYVAHSKNNQARNIDVWGVYFELEDDAQATTALEADEQGKFSVEWLDLEAAERAVKDPLHHYVYDKFIGGKVYTGYGPLVNSGAFDSLEGDAAKHAVVKALSNEAKGHSATKYKLRDWVFSRQHYWGEPIPVIHCAACKAAAENTPYIINVRDQSTWRNLMSGCKTIESRKLNPGEPERYFGDIKAGSIIKLVNKVTSDEAFFDVTAATTYKNLDEVWTEHAKFDQIWPGNEPTTRTELDERYSYTPDYVEEINHHGLVAWNIKRVIPGIVPVPEDQLPIELPPVESYEPTDTGESPLAAMTDWVNVTCPKCGGPAKRETDTMPNWAGSNWYYLRYMDAHNDQAFASEQALGYWRNVDMYLGGMEHTTLHLLYSRFCHQFLYDQKLVPTPEPYQARRGQGIVLAADGRKMSKSLGNVVNPSDIVARYGADTLRLYVMFMAPYDESTAWSEERLGGVNRFVYRVWSLAEALSSNRTPSGDPDGQFVTLIDRAVHKAIKAVHDDLGEMKFNTAISALMTLINVLSSGDNLKLLQEPRHAELAERSLRALLLITAPFAPFLTEQLWHDLGETDSIHVQAWPKYDPALLRDDIFELAVQVNGKLRGTIMVAAGASEADVTEAAKASPNVAKYLEGTIIKTIVVPRRLVNFVVK